MYLKVAACLISLSALSGCTTISDAETIAAEQASERDDGYRCDTVTVTGSRFPVRRCTTAFQRQQEAEDAKKVMDRAKASVGPQNQ